MVHKPLHFVTGSHGANIWYIPLVYNLRRCWTDVIAPSTESLLTLDLMLEAVPNSSANILLTREIWSLGGIINEIMLVPFLRTTNLNLDCFVVEHSQFLTRGHMFTSTEIPTTLHLPSRQFQTFDEFLDFPYLYITVGRSLFTWHFCGISYKLKMWKMWPDAKWRGLQCRRTTWLSHFSLVMQVT